MTAPKRPRGIGDADWETFLRDNERTEEALRTKVCPNCGGLITRKGVDKRQAGSSDQPGVWVNYICVRRCGWFMDRKETN